MHPGLAALIHPHPVAELHPHEAFVKHGRSDAVAELFALPLMASFDALLASWPDVVDVHLPDVADEASTIHASPHDARKLYASGMGLMFDDVHRYAPALVGWLDAIRADLGLSRLTQQRCLIYATPSGGGTAPHFDQNANFVLQLHGTKTWWLAPNTHVALPLTRHTMGLEPDPELQTYASLPLPTALPEHKLEFELVPGSVLFVPRGTWHTTHATTDSLQLNFTFSAPTWIDLLTAALRSRLALSPRWRETATPATGARFEALLRELADDAERWSAADILSVTEG
ncbi:MAG: cupin domain-containing protein [Kofleriaceae bacterium]